MRYFKHGVTAIDGKIHLKNINFLLKIFQPKVNGRWFMGLYTNDSDEIKNRTTSISYLIINI